VRELIFSERSRLAAALSNVDGLSVVGGAANFFLAQWQRGLSLDELLAALSTQGILVRDCRNFAGLEVNYFRFAVRLPEENSRLIEAIKAAAECQKPG
jgi:threonine-phosphate decarboxylase